MVDKNIQMHHHKDGTWNKLYPITNTTNVFDVDGKNVDEKIHDLKNETDNKIDMFENEVIDKINDDSNQYLKKGDEGLDNMYIPLQIRAIIGKGAGTSRFVKKHGNYLYVGAEDKRGVAILDITQYKTPTQVGFVEINVTQCFDIAIRQNLMFVASNDGIHVVDINNKNQPKQLSLYSYEESSGSGGVRGVAVRGNTVFFVSTDFESTGSITSIDVSDPYNPTQIDTLTNNDTGVDIVGCYVIKLKGDVAFVSSDNGRFITFDISDPSNISILNFVRDRANGMNNTRAFTIVDDKAYVCSSNEENDPTNIGDFFGVIDISDPSNLVIEHFINDTRLKYPRGIVYKDNICYISNRDNNKLVALDVKDPENISIISEIDVGDGSYALELNNDVVYVSTDSNIITVNIDDEYDLFTESKLYTDNIRDTRNFFIKGNYVYISTLTTSKFTIVDISDLSRPVEIASIETPELAGGNGVFVYGRYCYVACRDSGSFVVIDVTNPYSPRQVANITTQDLKGARRLVVDGKYCYVAIGHLPSDSHNNSAIASIDISNPINPSVVDYLNTNQAVGSVIKIKEGVLLASSYGEFGTELYTIDISDPTNLSLISTLSEGSFDSLRGVSLKDNLLFLSSSGNNSLHVVDVSDENNMVLLSTIQNSKLNGARANQVYGDYVYVASRYNSSVTTIDVSDINNMEIVDEMKLGIFDNAYGLRISKGHIFVSSALHGNSLTILG